MPSNLRFQPSLLRCCSERGCVCVCVCMYVCVCVCAGGVGGLNLRTPTPPSSGVARSTSEHVALCSVSIQSLKNACRMRRVRSFPPQTLSYRRALWRGGCFVLFFFPLSFFLEVGGGEFRPLCTRNTPRSLLRSLLSPSALRFSSFVLREIFLLLFSSFKHRLHIPAWRRAKDGLKTNKQKKSSRGFLFFSFLFPLLPFHYDSFAWQWSPRIESCAFHTIKPR